MRGRAFSNPFTSRWWRRTYLLTAGIGTALLVTIFVGYEIAERLWLRQHLATTSIYRLHMLRGIGASLALGTWTFYNVWRMRRVYDTAFSAAYKSLEGAMEQRTQALAKAHALTERLFDAIRDRLLVLDANGVVVKSNRAAGDVPAGKPCQALGPACDNAFCAGREAIRRGVPVVGECIRADSESGRVYAIDAYPVRGADGRPDLAIELLRDITEARQLEAQLRNQEKLAALGVLSAGIAHDIANPLASMSSELELLLEERDPERVRASASELLTLVARIDRTLREMTDFARRRDRDSIDAAVGVAVDDALRMVRHDPRARRVGFHTRIPPSLPRVRIVDDHLTMVLVNLLINAFDAMPQGGTITVTARCIGDYVRVSVSDSGIGMDETTARRATEPLFTTKPGRGTGLGLSISADILRDAGGALDIDSTPGVGTTVHLTCPVVEARRAAHA